MHKENSSKLGKRLKVVHETNAAALARDRAMERRILHGPDSDFSHGRELQSIDDSDTVAVDPQAIIDESNIGNKLLQKLGWKSGTNLGRGVDADATCADLRRDWERIEHIAKQGNN